MKQTNWILIIGALVSLNLGCSNAAAIVLDNHINQTDVNMNIIDSTYWKGPEQNGVFLISKNGFFGLADQHGTIITPVIYDRIFPFREGNAIMCRNNLYGVLDVMGNEITPPIYQALDDFSNGLCYGASTDFESVLLNLKGENIVPGKNIRISRMNGRYVQRENRSLFVFNRQGQKVFSTDFYAFDNYWSKSGKGNYWWFTDEPSHNRQEFQREPKIPQNLPFYFNEGLAVVPELCENSFKFGYIDTSGKQVIPFVFDEAKIFINGYACAKTDGKWGIIDQSGAWVLVPAFENLESTNGQYFIFSKGDLYGIVNLKGEIIVEAKYLRAKFLFDDVFAFMEFNEITRQNLIVYQNSDDPWIGGNYWGCINISSGKMLLPFSYNEVLRINEKIASGWNYSFSRVPLETNNQPEIHLSQTPPQDYVGIAKGQLFAHDELKGATELPKVLFPSIPFSPSYNEILQFDLFHEIDGYILISETYLDANGEAVVDKELITRLNAKLNRINITDSDKQLFGVNDWNGREILEKKFDTVFIVNTGIIAQLNGKYGFYDFNGNLILDHSYSFMDELPSGLLQVSTDPIVPNIIFQSFVINKSAIQIKKL